MCPGFDFDPMPAKTEAGVRNLFLYTSPQYFQNFSSRGVGSFFWTPLFPYTHEGTIWHGIYIFG